MQLEKLLKNYQILVKTTYKNKRLFICLNRLDFSVAFFQESNGIFENLTASEQIQAKFKKSNPRFQMLSFSANLQKYLRQGHIDGTTNAIQSLQKFTKNLPAKTQKKIIDIVDEVKFISLTDAPDYIKVYYKEQGFSAICIPSEKTIVLPLEVGNIGDVQCIEKTIIHELLHCFTHDSAKENDGFVDQINYINGNTKLSILRGEYFNEAMTEYFAEHMIEGKYPRKSYVSNYEISLMALTVLLNQLDIEKVKNYYFECSNRKISEYICEKFHVSNSTIVARMLALFDLATKSYLASLKNKTNDPLVLDCYLSLYQFVMDLIINKFVHENKSLEQLNMEYFFPCGLKNGVYNSLKNSEKLKKYLESAKLCVKYMPQCIDYDKQLSYLEYKAVYVEMLGCLAYAKPLPKHKKYDVLKNFETLYSVMFDHNNVIANNQNIKVSVKKCLQVICNFDNNFLPENKNKKLHIINQFLNAPNTQKIDPLEYLSVDLALEISKNSTKLYHRLCDKYTNVLLLKLDELSNAQKQDEYFVNSIFKFALKQTPNEAQKCLISYYDNALSNLDLKSIKKFTKKMNDNFKNTHLQDACEQVINYIKNQNIESF